MRRRGLPDLALLPAELCGVDEAGRGPLAGPVYAAAVVLDPARSIPGLADSKRLTARQREALAALIKERAAGWAIAVAEPAEIDAINILQASLLAMRRAVLALDRLPAAVWVDGNQLPRLPEVSGQVLAVIKGDARVAAISAASILAKTARDDCMRALALDHPGYGFDRHMGYPTAAHFEALARLGPCTAHRRSFRPVAAAARLHGAP